MTALRAVLVAAILSSLAGGALAGACRGDLALIHTTHGVVPIEVEIADDPAERAQGLMGRTSLSDRHGMLFIYETPQEVAFWMKNTLIPLDMLFIDATGVIRRIHAGARPHDETGIPGSVPGDRDPDRLMVLEIAGGEAARLGIAEGNALAHPRVPQQSAAAPC